MSGEVTEVKLERRDGTILKGRVNLYMCDGEPMGFHETAQIHACEMKTAYLHDWS